MATANKDFFANFSRPEIRVLEHDRIHAIVAGASTPLFYSLKENFDAAEVCEYLFDAMTTETRDRLIYEEVIVLAYERVIIPEYVLGTIRNGGTREQHLAAFDKYLRKIGGDLRDNPEWIRDYAASNYDRIWDLCQVPIPEVHERIVSAVLEGKHE